VEISYGSYTEEEYIRALHSCRFVVWVGGHESQGFALQEALACGVPIVAWDVEKLGDEWNREESRLNYSVNQIEYGAPATTIPWWDERCGIRVTEEKNLLRALFHMACTWDTFQPRAFVEETLSPTACARVWMRDSGGSERSGSEWEEIRLEGEGRDEPERQPVRVRFADTVSSFTEQVS
jgi:glycosyltransferase involved in cell wall biosynthesis